MRDAWVDWVGWVAVLLVGLARTTLTDGAAQLIGAGLTGFTLAVGLVGWLIGGHVSSLPWMWGATGERHTAAELDRLPGTWRTYHDLPDGRSNWDHVAIGPPGVFMIESKTYHRPASVDRDGLRSGRIRTSGSSHRGQAFRLKETLERGTGIRTWSQAVVAVWGEFPQREVEREKVVYLDATRLTAWLESRPARLSDAQLDRLTEYLERLQRDSSG
jgi:hypothetical protein